jgi:hypothetical protein
VRQQIGIGRVEIGQRALQATYATNHHRPV